MEYIQCASKKSYIHEMLSQRMTSCCMDKGKDQDLIKLLKMQACFGSDEIGFCLILVIQKVDVKYLHTSNQM